MGQFRPIRQMVEAATTFWGEEVGEMEFGCLCLSVLHARDF